MLILSASDVRLALPMDQTIDAMKRAFAAFSSGHAEVPLRTRLPVTAHDATSLFMPAYLADEEGEALAVKVVTLFPKNAQLGLPLIHAAVLLLSANAGQPIALLEGSTLTAIRTGAASGAATDLLARPESQTVAIFGAGVQARTQLAAVCTVRQIQAVWVFDPHREKAEHFKDEMAGQGSIPADLRVAANPDQAIREADVVCTATTSRTPVFPDQLLKPGAHINAVGSYTPQMQEIPAETVQRARLVVDSRTAVLAETGDILLPIQEGKIDASHIQAELGEIVTGRQAGRTDNSQITLFKSVGLAVQDAAAARLAVHNARQSGFGKEVDW